MSDTKFSALIGLIYQSALDGAVRPAMLNMLADTLGASQAASVFYDAATYAWSAVAPRQDPEFQQSYTAYWASRNFIRQRAMAVPIGVLMTNPMLASRAELASSDFYNEWLKPQGMDGGLAANLAVDGSAGTLVGVYRPLRSGEFDTDERELFSLLVPHFLHAASLQRQAEGLMLAQASSVEVLDRLHRGVLVVDASGKPLFVNRPAEMVFSGISAALRLDAGVVRATTPDAGRILRSAIAACAADPAAPGRQVPLPRENKPPVMCLVIPFRLDVPWFSLLQPAAILVLSDPEQENQTRLHAFRCRFRLTAAEAAFAGEIGKGCGRQAAADRLGISVSTARAHLTNIFDKTGTRRQAELVRLLHQTLH